MLRDAGASGKIAIMAEPVRRKRITIIGGGITGLSAAHRLVELVQEKGLALDVTLLEAGDRLGGVIHTVEQDGFLCEAGPENFVTNKPWGLALCRRLGLEDQIQPTNDAHRRALIVRRGRLLPIPEGFLLLAPTKIWPMALTPLFSLRGKMRMALEWFLPAAKRSSDDESLASFVTRRFGREALDRAVQPLIGGIYTADPAMLSLRATMPMFLEMEAKHGSVIRAMRRQAKAGAPGSGRSSGARYSLFVTLRSGLRTLVAELTSRIGSERIRQRTAVTSVARTADGESWSIRLADGSELESDGVIVAGPARSAADILHELDDTLAGELGEISYATSGVVHLGYRREQVPHKLDAFGFVVPAIEKRNVMATSFSSVKFDGRAPAGWVLLRAFVGGAMNRQIMTNDDAGLVAATRHDLAELLGITAEPGMTMVHRWPDSMPQYAVGHLERVETMRQRLAGHAGLELAGNGFEGVGIPDCINAGEQAAERVAEQLA